MGRGRFAFVLPCLALLLVPSAALAQRLGKAAAESLFERGRVLLAQQRTAEACAKFEASQELDAGVGTLLYLGECYERLGRTASAWATFKEAISLAQVRSDDRERLASIRAASLEPRLTRVILRVREIDRLAGLTIRVGRARIPRASWGVPLPVDPGRMRVEASAPGRQIWARSFELSGRGNWVIEVPRLRLDARRAGDPPALRGSCRQRVASLDRATDFVPARVGGQVALFDRAHFVG